MTMHAQKNWVKSVEEKLKRKNQILFSKDSECLYELQCLMLQQNHRVLVTWAFLNVQKPLQILRDHYPHEERPSKAVDLCKRWAAGEIKMPIAKKALLEVHAAAKEVQALEDVALFHAVGQALATVHVGTHAIGLPLYELTALVRHFGLEGCEQPIENRMAEYIATMQGCINGTERTNEKWATFLLK